MHAYMLATFLKEDGTHMLARSMCGRDTVWRAMHILSVCFFFRPILRPSERVSWIADENRQASRRREHRRSVIRFGFRIWFFVSVTH